MVTLLLYCLAAALILAWLISVIVIPELPRQREIVARELLNPELLPLGSHQRKERDYG